MYVLDRTTAKTGIPILITIFASPANKPESSTKGALSPHKIKKYSKKSLKLPKE